MRIRDLTVQSVLHFDEAKLDFAGPPALHLIYGANEAGKSTMLQLLVDLLFGGRLEDASRELYQSRSRLGATLEQPGQPNFLISRRKHRTQLALVDMHDQIVSQDVLQDYLEGMTRERYRLLFGFDHDRLRMGGDSLLTSGGHAGVSLFEAGGGVQVLQGALTVLGERLEKLADPSFRGNSRRLLNSEWRAHKDALAAIRGSGLRGDEWHAVREELTALEARIAHWRSDQAVLDVAHASLRRVQRVRPLLIQRSNLEERLRGYDGLPDFSRAWETRIPEAIESLRRVQEDLLIDLQEYTTATSEHSEIQVDDSILTHEEVLRSLFAFIEQYSQSLREIPLAQQRVQDREAQVLALLQDVAPGLDFSDAERLRVPLVQEEQLIHAAQQWQRAHVQASENDERYTEAVSELDARARAMQALAMAPDVAVLRRALAQARPWGDVDAALGALQSEWSQTVAASRAQWSRQSISSLSLEAALLSAPPLMATIERYLEEWQKHDQEQTQRAREVTDATRERAQVAEQLRDLELGGRVPVEEDLTEARAKRQLGWRRIKQVWLEGVSESEAAFGSGEPLYLAFESAVQGADEVADRLRREADRSARRAHLMARGAQLEVQAEVLASAQARHAKERESWWAAWRQEWDDFRVDVKTPAEMKAWLQDVWLPIVQRDARVQEIKRAHSELTSRRLGWLQGAVQALTELGHEDPVIRAQATGDELPLCSWSELVGRLESILQTLEEAARLREEGAQRVEESRSRVADLERKRQNAQEELGESERRWRDLTQLFPTLPPDPASATRYLSRVRELFQGLEEFRRAQSDLGAKVHLRDRFEQRALQIADELGDVPTHWVEQETKEALVTHLHQRMQRAKEDLFRRQTMEQRIKMAEAQLTKAQAHQETLTAELAMYRTHLCAIDEEALQQIVERAVVRRSLQEELIQLDKQLALAGDGASVDELSAEVTAALQEGSADTLSGRLEDLQTQRERLNPQIDEAGQRLGVLKERLRLWDGSQATAALKAQEAAYHLAEVDRLWQEYVRAALARRLLERGVERFREQTESAILGRASALFRQLTLGHYTELAVEYEDATPYIHAISSDGASRRTIQLSDGTRDQLHLALRLAFVEEYMTASEPLPLILDDILVHFDDERAAATLDVLLALSTKTQVIYFTHHKHIAGLVLRSAHAQRVRLHELGSSPTLAGRAGIL